MTMEETDVSCLHGSWGDGVCVCDRGYVTHFTEKELYPIYCAEKEGELVVSLKKGFEAKDFLHYTMLSLTMAGFIGSIFWFLFFLYTLLDTYWIGRRMKRIQQKFEEFKKDRIQRSSTEDLNAELWYPDLNKYKCANDPDLTEEKVAEEQNKILYAKVLHNYKPKAAGELRLYVGDTIKNVTRLHKGWCKGVLNGKSGFYPEAYAEMFEPTGSDLEDDDDLDSEEENIDID